MPSEDAQFVLFHSQASNLVDADTNALDDVFVWSRATGEVTRASVNGTGDQATGPSTFYPLSISTTGRYVGFDIRSANFPEGGTGSVFNSYHRDRQTGQVLRVAAAGSAKMTLDGRFETYATFLSGPANTFMGSVFVRNMGVPPDGESPAGDTDADGLPNGWETRFGLSSSSGAGDNGANGDPDADGRTNAQEFAAGTHPRGFVTRYLAEGATGTFFDTSAGAAEPRRRRPRRSCCASSRTTATTVSQHGPVPPVRAARCGRRR